MMSKFRLVDSLLKILKIEIYSTQLKRLIKIKLKINNKIKAHYLKHNKHNNKKIIKYHKIMEIWALIGWMWNNLINNNN